MDQIEKQVRRARRCLSRQLFLTTLVWTSTAALGLAVLLVLIDRFWPMGVIPWVWPAGAAVLGIIGAWIWSIVRSPDEVTAAIEIDRRFDLHERISSTLALFDADRDTPAAQALIKDASRRVERINVAERMRLSPSRRLLFPFIPAAIACLLIILVAPMESSKATQAKGKTNPVQNRIKTSTKNLQNRLAEHQKKAEKQNLKEVKDILKLLQKDLKKFESSPPADRQKALAKLNDLAKQLQEQRNKSSLADNLKNQLKQLKNLDQGPADRLAKAMKQGDFKKALEELNKLKSELASDKLNEQQRQQLAEQIEQMAQQMQKMADAHENMQQKLADEIQKMRDAGQMEQANKLEEQLAKLNQKIPEMQMLDKLAQQMQQCANACKQGQDGQAQQAMQQMADQMAELQQQMNQAEMLDQAMDQMAECREQMCGQGGEGECEGDQAGQACESDFASEGGLQAGHGHSPGGRHGDPPKVGLRDSQVRQEVGKGPMTVGGYLDGPNRKGEVGEAINEQVDAAKHGETDPLTDQQMPKKHRDHTREYLERLREGK